MQKSMMTKIHNWSFDFQSNFLVPKIDRIFPISFSLGAYSLLHISIYLVSLIFLKWAQFLSALTYNQEIRRKLNRATFKNEEKTYRELVLRNLMLK